MIEYKFSCIRVRIADAAHHSMIEEFTKMESIETGGLLIGSYDKHLHVATVTVATKPPNDSRHSRFGFQRGLLGTIRHLKRASHNGDYYLGEWHTHPGGPSSPSLTDIRQMEEISHSRKYHCPEPILIIVGGLVIQPDLSITVIMNGKVVRLEKIY